MTTVLNYEAAGKHYQLKGMNVLTGACQRPQNPVK